MKDNKKPKNCNDLLFYYPSDIDECSVWFPNRCHSKASCKNTPGSFLCICERGYTGNGTVSEGEIIYLLHSVIESNEFNLADSRRYKRNFMSTNGLITNNLPVFCF